MFFKRKQKPEPVKELQKHPLAKLQLFMPDSPPDDIAIAKPVAGDIAQNSEPQYLSLGAEQGMNNAVAHWFASQQFIGYPVAAWIAKHWLVDKAVSTPAKDSIRKGYQVQSDNNELIELLAEQDRHFNINAAMREFIRVGRRQGGALALFHTCPASEDAKEYYSAPLNLDAVTEYKGVTIVSPHNISPMPINEDINDPASLNYLKPSVYIIGGKQYHASHFVRFVPYPVDDILKPNYRYFGQSLPERIYEHVYQAERTSAEAPNLAMTKRLRVLGVDLGVVLTDDEAMSTLQANIRGLQDFADNSGVFVYDTGNGGGMTQIDTALGDLDNLIITQYQLCAAIAEIPASKLLEQSIGGLGSTGEYEQDAYFERLESLQTNDLQPMLEKHHEIIKRINGITDATTVTWQPLDSPDAKEYAEIDQANTQTVATAVSAGVIGQEEGREILNSAKDGLFFGRLEKWEADHTETDALIDAILDDENNQETPDMG